MTEAIAEPQVLRSSASRSSTRAWIAKARGTLVAIGVLVAAILVFELVNPKPFSYFDLSTVTGTAGGLALAGIGETIVVIAGGLDLSVGAVISLVNVLLVTLIGSSKMSIIPYTFLATVLSLGVGGSVGLLNGFLVAYLRMQAIVVTLATMFIIQGLVLLIQPVQGGQVSDDFSMIFVGDAIPNFLPAPIIIMVLAILVWLYLKRTRFGVALYAIGSDSSSAAANRVDVRLTRMLSFVAAGMFFGWAGMFLTANIGGGDPLIGAPMLLKVFAVVVLGGTAIGGGRGGSVGAVFGAITLTLIVNIFLIMGIRDYYVPIVEGIVLVLAALGLTIGRRSPLFVTLRRLLSTSKKRQAPVAPMILRRAPSSSAASNGGRSGAEANWFQRNANTLRLIYPSYAMLLVTIAITTAIYGRDFRVFDYLRSLMTFATFMAVLGLGQGAVVLVGGLDLSVIWAITLSAIIAATPSCVGVTDTCFAVQQAIWAIPEALAVGLLIGLVNGSLVVGFRLSPVVATLAVGGVLEGVALLYNHGAQGGGVPPILKNFVTERVGGLPLLLWLSPLFVACATLLLSRSGFGRRLYAVGNNEWVAKLSGVRTGPIILGAYVLSGFCSSVMGLLLAGFSQSTFYDMGRPFLMASIAVVVLGGTSISGGKGHYLGILGGALLYTALGSMLAGTTVSEAVRSIIYGAVILGAVMLLRDKRTA
jgi:ribose transport system permease protein